MEENNENQGNKNINQPVNQPTNQPVNQPQQPNNAQVAVPNATGILVMGILSILICGVGLVLSIIALVMSGKAKKAYIENPQLYTESSFNNIKVGKICAIIGLVISACWLLYFIFLGSLFAALPWADIMQNVQ